jgi:putative ABC transport system substrate-binding protein
MLIANRRRIITFAAQHRIAAIYTSSGWAEAGGLMEYAPNWRDMYLRAAAYVDRILRGAKPADLPVEQPTKFDLVINLKTAKALGLTVPSRCCCGRITSSSSDVAPSTAIQREP